MTAIDQHLRGPWLAVLADYTGHVWPTFKLAADVLVPETEMNIRIVRGTAMPVGDDDHARLADEYAAADEIFEITAPLIDDDYPGIGAQARYAQAKAMADGLNNAGEVDRLRAMDCGSDQTWRDAGRTPPHVITWDDTQDAIGRAYKVADELAGAGDAETARRIREALRMPSVLDSLAALDREQAEAHQCDCCHVDGHTRRCGRTATTDIDIAPFGILAVAPECRERIIRTGSAAERPEYLIWSHHHKSWWGPNGSGYRSSIADAGRYTLAERAQWLGRGCACCEVPEVPVPAEQVFQDGVLVDLDEAIADATTAAIEAGDVNRHYAGGEVPA